VSSVAYASMDFFILFTGVLWLHLRSEINRLGGFEVKRLKVKLTAWPYLLNKQAWL